MISERRFEKVEAAALALAEDIAEQLRIAISERGVASMAVSGGRTPVHVFPTLAAADVDWRKVYVTLTDERWVEPEHKDSNEGLARRLLLVNRASKASFIGLKTERGADQTEEELKEMPWPLDAVFLGIGEDGHIASLFPGDRDWEAAPGHCVAVAGTETRQARISLTPRALLDCRKIFIILSGTPKAAALESAKLSGPTNQIPLRLVLHQNLVPVSIYIAD